VSLLEAAVERAASVVAKAAADPAEQILRDAARAALGNPDMGSLEQVLRQVFADAYGAGGHAATQQLPNTISVSSLEGVSAVDWSTWKPGDPAAAGLLSNGGLQSLLNAAGVTVKGIGESLVGELGNAIAAGVAAGESTDRVARGLVGIVGSRSRAEMIAHTETARAVTAATLNTYAVNGVQQWSWVLSSGACPACEKQASLGPFTVKDEAPPLHPRCRCAASPVVESIVGAPAGSGGSLLGNVAGAFQSAVDEAAAATGGADAAAAGVADLSAASDADLAALLSDAAAQGDDAAMERVLGELDRRDQVAAEERAAAEKKAASQAKRDAKAQALEADRNAQLDAAIARGEDPEVAYAEIWGKDLERVRIQSAMQKLRAAGYTGRNYEELCMSQFKEYADRAYLDAEKACRGRLVSRAAEKAGVNPRTLFTGQDVRARKYASEELLGYWQQYGRLTLHDFMAANLGQSGTQAARAYYL
jgi:SPP1 gp7 family putative phage head morphogenesis protein